MKSLLPSEKVLGALVVKIKSNINNRKAKEKLIKILKPYLYGVANKIKSGFYYWSPFLSVDDLVSESEVVLFERIINNWNVKKGRFTNYLTRTIHLEMFNRVNSEIKKTIKRNQWLLTRANFEGRKKSNEFVYIKLLLEPIKKINPVGVQAIMYELKNGRVPIRKLAKIMKVPKSTLARKRTSAISYLRKILM